MDKSRSRDRNAEMKPFVVVCVAAALWLAALLYSLGARAKCAELAGKDAANRQFAAELAPALDAIRTHNDFIAALPAGTVPAHAFAGASASNTKTSVHNGLAKTSIAVKWNAIGGADFADLANRAGTAGPPMRLESVTVTKAATPADAIAVDATFSSYSNNP